MNLTDLTNILQQPQAINELQTHELRSILDQHPYFQSARALYLKGLKNQESFLYNQELKKTAAYTTDRSILFDYITSDIFKQNETSKNQQKLQQQINDIEVIDATEINSFESATAPFDAEVTNPELFEEKAVENIAQVAEDNLEIGKPLEFNQEESHSFSEWLQLTSIKPIEREKENIRISQEKALENKPSKFDLIDKFIENNPKIKPPKKTVSLKNLAKENSFNSDELMTETLAKVYLEQKNYKKAKQAYRILSLKYPEKSSFFADRITEIKKLENQ